MKNINHEFIELTHDAAVKAYWRKKSFRSFLSSCGVSETTLSTWIEGETKRDFLHRVLERAKKSENGPRVISQMAKTLSEKESFPDLEHMEDSAVRIQDAKAAALRLGEYLGKLNKKKDDEKLAALRREEDHKERLKASNHNKSLNDLENRLMELSKDLGQQKAGYAFEKWFYDFIDFHEIPCKRPYVASGRQIDGSITVNGTTYLVELKFKTEQSGATDIDSMFAKVETKADNTMGIVLSISGYSSVAILGASKAKSVLLLLDFSHLQLVLRGQMSFNEVMDRSRRHASQTGEAYLLANLFGN